MYALQSLEGKLHHLFEPAYLSYVPVSRTYSLAQAARPVWTA